jgi:uncharacterized protein
VTGKDAAAPASATDRIEAIDALRGFALLGILFANLPYWAGVPFAQPADAAVIFGNVSPEAFGAFFNGVLDGKFYTLFSLLFGLGFALQLERLERRGADGLRVFRRRMAALLLIGCVHIFLIWDGDILTLYAALGFVLPLFRKASERALIGWALLFLFAVPMLGVLAGEKLGFHPGAPLFALGRMISGAFGIGQDTNLIDYIRTGGWGHFIGWQSNGWAFNYADRLENGRIAKVLGTMLLGMMAGRRLMAGTLLGNRRLLWSLLIGGLVIGLPPTLVYMHLPPHSQASWPSLVGTAPMGIAYGAAFLLAWPHATRVLGVLSPVGRMALTNYLTHSVLGALLFYGIGLGLMGRVPIEQVYLIGIAIYAAQILLSRWWLSGHKQGPMETLWRRMTYGSP